RKRRPRNAAANGSSKSRVVAERADSLALQTATTVAVRLTASCIGAVDPPPADPLAADHPPDQIRPIRVHGASGGPPHWVGPPCRGRLSRDTLSPRRRPPRSGAARRWRGAAPRIAKTRAGGESGGRSSAGPTR